MLWSAACGANAFIGPGPSHRNETDASARTMHDSMHGESKKGRLVRREASCYKWDASADLLIGPGRDSRPMRAGNVLGTAVLWGVLSVAVALLAQPGASPG